MPRLPVPANKSRTTFPYMSEEIILKSDSLTRSVVGLVVSVPFGVFSLCPLAIPEITLKMPIPP